MISLPVKPKIHQLHALISCVKRAGLATALRTALGGGAGLLLASSPALGQGVDDLLDDLIEDAVLPGEEAADEELFDDGLDDLLGGGGLIDDEALDSIAAGSSDSTWAGGTLDSWKGFFEVKPRVFTHDRGGRANDEQLLIQGEMEFQFSLSERIDAYYRPRIFIDALDGDLRRFEPYEAYATYEGEGWDLRAGQFVENWGVVDTFNPIDVINRRDFGTDVLDADRLGELGFRLRRFFDGGDVIGEPVVSLYALPLFRTTPFPPEDQRFSLGPGFEDGDGFEPTGIEQAFVAGRFQSTLRTGFADADIQAVVAHGPERVPTIFASGPILQPAYFGITTVGAGFRAVPNEDVAGRFLSTLTLKAEVVYKAPYVFDGSPVSAPDDYLTAVVGVDRGFYGVFTDLDQVTMTVEYAREEGADDPAALLRPFRNDLILRGLWEANDFARQSLELRGLFDLDQSESVVELIYERQLRSIHPDLQFGLEARSFQRGDEGTTFFSLFPNNSSIAASLRWDF